jgi:sugar phosphate permease
LINLVSNRLARQLPFYYGYVMMPVAMLLQVCTSPGQTFAVSAFTPAIRESLGLSDSALSFAYMMGTLLAAIPLSTIGPASDRWGLRGITALAVIALAGTCLFASTVSGFSTLLLAFFLLRFLGQGSLTLLSGNTIAMWFRSRIGRVSALMSVGTAVAFAWVPEWISNSIAEIGWRETYRGMALLVLLVMIPVVLVLFRNRPEDLGQHVDGIRESDQDGGGESRREETRPAFTIHHDRPSLPLREAMRNRAFYIVGLTGAFWAMTGTGILFYLFTLCEDRGMSADVPADMFKTFGLSMLALQLLGGVLSDYLPLNRLLGIGAAMLCVALAVLWVADAVFPLHLFAGLFGGGQGLLIAINAVVWVRYFGREHLGSIRGTVWCLTVAGSGCGPLIMGVVRDATGTFDPAIAVFFSGMCPLAVAAWLATPPRRVAEVEG